MNTTSITSRTKKRLVVAAMAVASSVAVGSAAAAQADPPDWDRCVRRDLPIAAGAGGILPVNVVPPPEMQAALRGEIEVGTDCSIYDLPIAAGVGGILPVNVVPPPEMQAALRGEIEVGTD